MLCPPQTSILNPPLPFTRTARVHDPPFLPILYFTHLHHTRFLQIVDLIVYLAGRFENKSNNWQHWHAQQLFNLWKNLKANIDFSKQFWS